MKATVQRRLTLLVGLVLLSLLLVFAIGVPVAQAMLVSGSGGGSVTTSAAGPGAEAASSGTSSTAYWLIGSAVALLIAGIGAWALARRRRQSVEAPACELSVAGC